MKTQFSYFLITTLIADLEITTIAKIIAATNAIVEPVPEFISDEMYIPDMTEINPMT